MRSPAACTPNALDYLGFIVFTGWQLGRHIAINLCTGLYVISGLLRFYFVYISTFAYFLGVDQIVS